MSQVTELIKALAQLSPEEAAAVRAVLAGPQVAAPKTPKFSPALDAVPVDQVDDVVKACRQALTLAKGKPANEEPIADMQAALADFPVVWSAATTNSAYRGKPLSHSLRVAVQYLEARHGSVG